MNRKFSIPKKHPAKRQPRPATRFKVYTVERAKAQFDKLLADAEAGCVIDITRRGRAIVSVLSNAKLETLEILAHPEAMRAIQATEDGKTTDMKKPRARRKARLEIRELTPDYVWREYGVTRTQLEAAKRGIDREIAAERKAGTIQEFKGVIPKR